MAAPTDTSRRTMRLGTRTSPLALAQTSLVRDALLATHPNIEFEVVPMATTGDIDHRDFQLVGQRGMFAVELERALLDGSIDLAVHSCKDLTLELPAGLAIAAVPEREDPRDVLCGDLTSWQDLPLAARIATSSLRRSAALQLLRADFKPVGIRGNVQTRLRTAHERGDAACMLAAAGMRRLGLGHDIAVALPVERCVPEAAQGAIAVQVRRADLDTPAVNWAQIEHAPTRWAVEVERAVAHALGGGCETPIGVHVDLGWANVPVPAGGPTAYVFAADPADLAHGAVASCPIDPTTGIAETVAVVLAAVAAAALPGLPLSPTSAAEVRI